MSAPRVVAVQPLGDAAVRVRVDGGDAAARAAWAAAARGWPGVEDAAWGEHHLLIVHRAPLPDLPARLDALTRQPAADLPPPRTVRIRARYDGPDLADVAGHAGLRPADVIERHAGLAYTVQAVGFQPGIAYLGPVDAALVLPRRSAPRPRVPAGAIGLAGARTAVYPHATPGGWHLIATAVDFDAFDSVHGAALQVGDAVRFEPVA